MGKDFSSLLYPNGKAEFRDVAEVTLHDLGMDAIVKNVAEKETEQKYILKILSKMTDDPLTTQYRCDIFTDIYQNPQIRSRLMEIMDKINFLRDYGSFQREYEETASIWDLMHRLDEIKDYIQCVEAFQICLSEAELHSEGLKGLKKYVEALYHDQGFEELKKDIRDLRATTSDIRSITVGINLNERFEADGIGLISVNSRYFTKSGVIGNFCDMISSKNEIRPDTEWNGKYKYYPVSGSSNTMSHSVERAGNVSVAMEHPIAAAGIAVVPKGDSTENITKYMDRVTNHMISLIVKKLRSVLNRYVLLTITDITKLMPEFFYYIRWAEYIENLEAQGLAFCRAGLAKEDTAEHIMRARGIYNLKLASVLAGKQDTIVTNDLDFDRNHLVYLLTGANRGGKTTITQAIGLLFVLAQGGIFVPGDSFVFHPVDNIYTHFPVDEDKTMDLGRLGEECKRFRELYYACTQNSLLLLNETFSTTSFEEGYFIAKDSVKAILAKGIRTIYNTHMHKLAYDIEEINESKAGGKAVSLIVKAEDGKRSFKVELAPPEGMSYAQDIAKKYGVTYEMLMGLL